MTVKQGVILFINSMMTLCNGKQLKAVYMLSAVPDNVNDRF